MRQIKLKHHLDQVFGRRFTVALIFYPTAQYKLVDKLYTNNSTSSYYYSCLQTIHTDNDKRIWCLLVNKFRHSGKA